MLKAPAFSEHLAFTRVPGRDLANLLPLPKTEEVAESVIEKSYRKSLNAMSRMVQLGVVASQFAMHDAGLKRGDVVPARFGHSRANRHAEAK